MQTNETSYDQHVNYQQEAPVAAAAETIGNQQPSPPPPPPPPLPMQGYPQNISQPSAAPNILYQTRSYHETTYHVPPEYIHGHMLPYINHEVSFGSIAPVASVPVDPNWKTGLFDCLDDPMNAFITLCLPCLTFDQIANIVDEGNTSCGTSGLIYGLIAIVIGIPCILSCTYRTRLRNKFGIVEDVAPDWVTHFLCECCALCQEHRELQLRGWDPSIGWHGNMARRQNMQHQQPVVLPPTYQTMNG